MDNINRMKIIKIVYILLMSGIYNFSAVAQPVINNGFGEYLLVPGGEFLMGDNFNEGHAWELPVHAVYLDSFYIGKFELPNCEYKKFIDDGGYKDSTYWAFGGFGEWGDHPRVWNDALYRGGGVAGNDSFPVSGVTLYEAYAYCSWLSEKTGKTYRIPTEAEWEKAAKGTDQRRYAWGNNIDSTYANYYRSGDPFERYDYLEIAPGVTPVGFYNGRTYENFTTHDNASPYGAYDMTGNIFEWCSDWFDTAYYSYSPYDNPKGPASALEGFGGTMRGSFWTDNERQMVISTLRCASRSTAWGGRSYRLRRLGFRCIQEVNDSASTAELSARFSADILSGEAPLTVSFTDESNIDSISWFWDFGDGNNSTEQNPIHEFMEVDRFEVRLEISNDTSQGLFIGYITVLSPVIAGFTTDLTSGYAPLEISFTDISKGNNIISWKWDFNNDGIIDSEEQNPVYTYDTEGTYTVVLSVSDGTYTHTVIHEDYITVSIAVSSDKYFENRTIMVYPNPTTGKVLVDYSDVGYIPAKLEILSAEGKIIREYDIKRKKDEHTIELSFNNKGTFLLRFIGEGNMVIKKLIVL